MALQPKMKGDTWNGLEIIIDNPDLDFTNCTARMQFRKERKDGSVAFEYKTEDASIIRNVNVFKMASKILNFTAGTYFFDLEITFANGVIQTFLNDKITIIQDVSN